MERLLYRLEERLRKLARAAAEYRAARLLIVTGLGFLTVAAWIALADLGGALLAALVLGVFYLLCGGIALYLAAASAKSSLRRPPPRRRDDLTFAALIEGFIVGLRAGRATRGDDRR